MKASLQAAPAILLSYEHTGIPEQLLKCVDAACTVRGSDAQHSCSLDHESIAGRADEMRNVTTLVIAIVGPPLSCQHGENALHQHGRVLLRQRLRSLDGVADDGDVARRCGANVD